jgi:hypothetical protein
MKNKTLFSILAASSLLISGFSGTAAMAAPTTAPTCNGVTATIVSGKAEINGTKGNDVIVVTGDRTKHTVNAGNGNDIICDSNASDTINGGNGNDTIVGGTGAETLNGGTGDDTIIGAAGNDTLNGGAGNDSLSGGTGNDTLNGGAGTNSLDGNDGADVIQPSGGKDTKHTDSKDIDKDSKHGTKLDDSTHAVIPQDVTDFLTAANTYMLAAVTAGDLTGTGTLALVLPDAPKAVAADATLVAPTSATVVINSVTWATKEGKVRYCVDGSNDTGKTFFKVRPFDEGSNQGARITTGKCQFDYKAPTVDNQLSTDLTTFSNYMIAALAAKGIAASGADVVLPTSTVALTDFATVPTSSLVKNIFWKTSPEEGKICVSGTLDGTTFFRAETEVKANSSKAPKIEIKAGVCKVEGQFPKPENNGSGQGNSGQGGQGGNNSGGGQQGGGNTPPVEPPHGDN